VKRIVGSPTLDRTEPVRRFIIHIIAGMALSAPAIAGEQEIPVTPVDAYHVRIGDLTYDIRTGSSDDGRALRGPSATARELVRIRSEAPRDDPARDMVPA
jgi:hypothetical protein